MQVYLAWGAVLLAASPILCFLYSLLCLWGIVPNEDCYHRSAIAYVRASTRTMASALENDQIERGAYIPGTPYWGPFALGMIHSLHGQPTEWVDPYNRSMPASAWRVGPKHQTDRGAPIRIKGLDYQYYTNGQDFWALISRGPDGDLDTTSATLMRLNAKQTYHERNDILAQSSYDPSNGTVSNGDIFRVKQE